jgi:hypothetical protein
MKRLLLDLYDRKLISRSSLQIKMDLDPKSKPRPATEGKTIDLFDEKLVKPIVDMVMAGILCVERAQEMLGLPRTRTSARQRRMHPCPEWRQPLPHPARYASSVPTSTARRTIVASMIATGPLTRLHAASWTGGDHLMPTLAERIRASTERISLHGPIYTLTVSPNSPRRSSRQNRGKDEYRRLWRPCVTAGKQTGSVEGLGETPGRARRKPRTSEA